MSSETPFEDIVPLRPQEEDQRRAEADALQHGATAARESAAEAEGRWEFVRGMGILFSAPHEAAQVRAGVPKAAETGTAELAFGLAAAVGGSGLATVGAQDGDPNWDLGHPYVALAGDLAGSGSIIDLHMMRPRGLDVCLGLGPLPALSDALWKPLAEELVASGLRVSVNWPFAASARTVTGQLQRLGRRAVQVELSWDCFDRTHPAMHRSWSALARAARRMTGTQPAGG